MADWSVKHYCKCGAAFELTTDSADAAKRTYAIFLRHHTGPGHARTTRAKAKRARRHCDKGPDRAEASERNTKRTYV